MTANFTSDKQNETKTIEETGSFAGGFSIKLVVRSSAKYFGFAFESRDDFVISNK